jgi:hypothetical protein
MSRQVIPLCIASVLLGTTAAAADTFAGWRYSSPPGYTVETSPDHVSLTKVAGSTFCSIAIFEPRTLESALPAEQTYEWRNVVTHTFSTTVKRFGSLRTRWGAVATTTATLVDADGNRYAGIHYAVAPPGMIGSVLLTSSTHASLASCTGVATAVVRSLEIDWTAPRFVDPEARVETPLGRWATVGDTNREYTFARDGTYRFHSETTGEPLRVLDESGAYTWVTDQLTLTPQIVNAATITYGVGRIEIAKAKLKKTTYSWTKRYIPETNEWRIVLTPRKATARDGKLPAGGASYQYSDRDHPAWKFAPQPGA